jgi:hypothetical protein
LNHIQHRLRERFTGVNHDAEPMCFAPFQAKRLFQPRLPIILQTSEHPKHMGLRSGMDSGTLVQHAIDRRSTQTRCRDNFIDSYAPLNTHIPVGAILVAGDKGRLIALSILPIRIISI